MNLGKKELIGLPVFTQSNENLGKVCDFELDSATQKIFRYHVKSERIIKDILAKELIISTEQIVSVDKSKMVVEDNVAKEKKQAYEVGAVPV